MTTQQERIALGAAAAKAIRDNLPVDGFGQMKRLSDYASIWGVAARNAVLSTIANAGKVIVAKPTFGTKTDRAAQFLVDAAWKLRNGYTPGGSTVTGGIAQLLEDVAAQIDPAARTTYAGHVPNPRVAGEEVHVMDLTYEERKALPAIYHRPMFDDLGVPHSWICTVCWDEGLTTGWPCAPAIADGVAVALHLGLEHTR